MIVKLIPPVQTGNRVTDQLATSQHVALESAIHDLVALPELRVPVWQFIQDEKKVISATKDLSQNDKNMDVLPSGVSLSSEECEEIKFKFVLEQSDLTLDELTKLTTADKRALDDLFRYGTLLPMKQKLPPYLLIKEVLLKLCCDQAVVLENRLSEIKKDGQVTAAKINFEKLTTYEPTFENGVLIKLRHILTNESVEVDKAIGVNKRWQFDKMSDDFAANVSMDPLPPLKLESFFDISKTGPATLTNYGGKGGALQKASTSVYNAYLQKKKVDLGYSLASEAKESIHAAKKVGLQSKIEKARNAGKIAAKARAARSKYSVG